MSYFKQVYDKLQSDILEIWMYKKEVETLEGVLSEEEEIEFASAGTCGDVLGLWVVTTSRLLCVTKEEEGIAVRGVAYEGIKNVMKDEFVDEQQMGAITIYFTEGDQMTIKQIKETTIGRFIEAIQMKITEEVVYQVEDELSFYMTEVDEKVIHSVASLYKGRMQYAYLTPSKWMIFGYGETGNDVVFGNLKDTLLMETTYKPGEITWLIHTNDHLGVFYLASETSSATRFKQSLLQSILEVKKTEPKPEFVDVVDMIDSFYTSLSEMEISFLALFTEGAQINHHFLFARSHGLMWSSFVDGINEKAIEHRGDLLFVEEGEHCVWQEDVYPRHS